MTSTVPTPCQGSDNDTFFFLDFHDKINNQDLRKKVNLEKRRMIENNNVIM
jgi:hypothetical protein